MNLLFGGLALLCGLILTTQVGANNTLGKAINPYLATVYNEVTGLVLAILVVLVVARQLPTAAQAQAVPWWAWSGGMLGTIYVMGNILLAPRLGAAALVGCILTGQLVFAVVADHFGWLGFEQHGAHVGRIAGVVLMIGGVTLIAKY